MAFYFFNGFLSEKPNVTYGAHRVDDKDDSFHPIWGDPGRQIAEMVDDKVYVVNYPARQGFLEHVCGEISSAEFWRRTLFWLESTLPECDNFAREFAPAIDPSDVVIGMSLGARVALRIRQQTACHAISLGAPISYGDIDWERFRKSDQHAEVFYTSHDKMLQLFNLRFWDIWPGTVLGCHGVPEHLEDMLHGIDYSPNGHGDYMPLERPLEHSLIFQSCRTTGRRPHYPSDGEVMVLGS